MPVEPWEGVRPARRFAPTAPQPPQGFTIIPEPVIAGGDAPACLSLNVFTPELGDARLPVLVWIHGGGYTTGTPSSVWYDGRNFNRDGVVVVSIGYRLGAEGFLVMDGAPPNRGVLDWLAGLAWVQRNIAAFGGDPDRVTIGGQSAGGGACATLATLPRAQGLFHQVLAMSGSVDQTATLEAAARTTAAVAAAAGVAPTAAALATLSPDQLVEAQIGGAERSHIDTAGRVAGIGTLVLPYRPVVDGDVDPGRADRRYRAGVTDDRPILLGATSQEFDAALRDVEMDDARLARRLGRLGLDDEAAATYERADARHQRGPLRPGPDRLVVPGAGGARGRGPLRGRGPDLRVRLRLAFRDAGVASAPGTASTCPSPGTCSTPRA